MKKATKIAIVISIVFVASHIFGIQTLLKNPIMDFVNFVISLAACGSSGYLGGSAGAWLRRKIQRR